MKLTLLDSEVTAAVFDVDDKKTVMRMSSPSMDGNKFIWFDWPDGGDSLVQMGNVMSLEMEREFRGQLRQVLKEQAK